MAIGTGRVNVKELPEPPTSMERAVVENGENLNVQFFDQWPSGVRHVLHISAVAPEGSHRFICESCFPARSVFFPALPIEFPESDSNLFDEF
jgi:hypothetical protein